MFVGEKDHDFELARLYYVVLRDDVEKSKHDDVIDNIIQWIHLISSNKKTYMDIPNTVYNVVSLALEINPKLFSEEIPSDSYSQLRDTFGSYEEFRDRQAKEESIKRDERYKMHEVLTYMRKELSEGSLPEFNIHMIDNNTFMIKSYDKNMNIKNENIISFVTL